MSGFFKKLFHRLGGKGNLAEMTPESSDTPEVEKAVADAASAEGPLPAPEEIIEIQAEDGPVEVAAPAPVKKTAPKTTKPAAKKAPAKTAKGKKAAAPKAAPKRAEPARPAKKAAAKKPAPQKPEARRPAAKKSAAHKPAVVIEDEVVEEVITPPPPAPEAEPAPEAVAPEDVPVAEAVPEEISASVAEEAAAPATGGWFARLREGLSKSSRSITGSIGSIFTQRKLDATTLQELEDVLIQADLGLPVSERIIAEVSRGRFDKEISAEEVKAILASEVAKVLRPVEIPFTFGAEKPYVILVVGVNGGGKTTTIGKLGAIAAREGFKVMFAACDTFRAAAIEQLTVWGQRIGARTISRPTGADAAGLAFDALKEAQETATDILFLDTAGRLQNKAYLMDELDKVVRVIKKRDQAAPHAVLLVLDATTGQNAMAQADVFTKVAGVTGIIMTKLDGTARGGILVAIADKFKLPVHAIGVGEGIDDLQAFDAEGFARAIAGLGEA
jgi:fused signal recognition particle receptor